jgi:hypothetical protein
LHHGRHSELPTDNNRWTNDNDEYIHDYCNDTLHRYNSNDDDDNAYNLCLLFGNEWHRSTTSLLSYTSLYDKHTNDNDDNEQYTDCHCNNYCHRIHRYAYGWSDGVSCKNIGLYLYGQTNNNRLHDGWIYILLIDWHRLLFVVDSRKTCVLHNHNNYNYTTDYDRKNNN